MYANCLITEPIEKIIDDWDFFEDKVIGHFSTFKPEGQNIYGIRKRDINGAQVVDPRKGSISAHFELGPSGLRTFHHAAFKLHITAAGTPHHVAHNYGYWHINDMDELYLPLPSAEPEGPAFFTICMGNPGPGDGDSFAWYCQTCYTLLFERRYETGRLGFTGFWRAERDAVDAYNSDPKHQLCLECGRLNERGYVWMASKDSDDERAARQAW